MSVVVSICGGVALAAWFLSAWSAVQMVRRRAPDVTLGHLLTHGIAFFDRTKFRPDAEPWIRRLRIGFALFFAAVLVGIGAAALVAAT